MLIQPSLEGHTSLRMWKWRLGEGRKFTPLRALEGVMEEVTTAGPWCMSRNLACGGKEHSGPGGGGTPWAKTEKNGSREQAEAS